MARALNRRHGGICLQKIKIHQLNSREWIYPCAQVRSCVCTGHGLQGSGQRWFERRMAIVGDVSLEAPREQPHAPEKIGRARTH